MTARIAAFLAGCSLLFSASAQPPVRVWEEKIVIPTYLAGPPEPNPMFFFGRASQGAQGPVYPYPMYDSLTGRKVDTTYTAVYLENEYLRIGVLPEIGGRIFEGIDKTNGYNFIYRQHVIKPALIGLIGAWISGGLEWNIPHHHRASTFIPVQYRMEENADGSKTVWIGELEVRQRMRWAVGYTLRPGKAYLEASVRILNRTPIANSMLCFANLAVHANQDYQVIFPPGTQYGVFHGKREFTAWPVSTSVYNGADFTKGVDISWYKNHHSPNSVFAWNYQDDFFAGYDHGKDAGTMSVADHNIVPGKKFWTWGNGPDGRAWDRILTDDDGPYIELMTGAYSDNQPDYSWLEPFETRSFVMNWYPFHAIGGVKKANLFAAVNLEIVSGSARVGFYTTSAHTAARVRIEAGGRTLLEEAVSIDPARPYLKTLALPQGIDDHDVTASLWDEGRVLVSYRPIRVTPEPMPKVVSAPLPPREVRTNEELYLIGLRAQQFHDPAIDPLLYWEEALRRDPGDARVNTALGITYFRKARYADAERCLRTALDRLTDRYTSPKDGEATYYLGATLKAAGRNDEAYQYLYKATWNQEWKAAACYLLAEVAASRADWPAALDFVSRSLDFNALNIRAINLKAALLRHLDRNGEALEALASAHRADPLDVRSMAEKWLAKRDPQAGRELALTMSLHPATAQETAAEYLDAGLWQDGSDALSQLVEAAPDKSKIHPMVYYYLGYFAGKLGRPQEQSDYYKLAAGIPPDYVFPFENEEIDVLRAAAQGSPHDPRAPYYLGNLLYDWQPDEAMKMWAASEAIDPSFAIVHRNLATGYAHREPPDTASAIAELEKAVAADRKYALDFTELDQLYEETGTPLEKRLALFERNAAVVSGRDDAENRFIALDTAAGRYDEAIGMMTGRQFAVAEGENLNLAEHWTDAHLLRARKSISAGRFDEALADLQAAVRIPTNLPMGDISAARRTEAVWWTGVAYEGLGERQKAVDAWKRAADQPAFGGHAPDAGTYYEGLILQKLGQSDKARTLFVRMTEARRSGAGSERVREANAHYIAALGRLGLGERALARTEMERALELMPDLADARADLAELR